MLKSNPRSEAETQRYLEELRGWLNEVQSAPAEEMAAFFEKRLDIYEDVHLEHWGKEYGEIAAYLEEGISTLLDLGCGTGLELASVYKRFPSLQVTGVDLCGAMLQKLRETYQAQRPNLIEADYITYPFEETRYDAVLTFETLHHFEQGTKRRIFEKIFKALRDGGCYVQCDYLACCGEEEAICLAGYEARRRNSAVPRERFVHFDIPLTLEHETRLLRSAGFQSVDVLYENRGTVLLRAKKKQNM